jgi:hypothetical protein
MGLLIVLFAPSVLCKHMLWVYHSELKLLFQSLGDQATRWRLPQ